MRGHRGCKSGIATRCVLLCTVIALIGLVSGCGGKDETQPTKAVPKVLRCGYSSSVTTWDPSVSYSTEIVYLANCYEPLLYANSPDSAEPFSPALATSWDVSDDGLEWTFTLRKGVKFHDGTPFNAEAVKFSIDRTMELNLGAAFIWEPVKEIQVIDDYTVKFLLKYPTALDRIAASSSGSWIFSPATRGKDQAWWDEGREVGTGPWILESYKADEELVFVRNPDWWGGWKADQYEKVVVKMVSDAGTQRQLLEGGQLDFINYVVRDQVEVLDAQPNIDIVKITSWTNYQMSINAQRPPLNNVKVRQALSYAVPYEDILSHAVSNLGTVANGPVPAGLWPNGAGDLPQYNYDPEKAKALFKEAGVDPSSLKLTLTHSSENPISESIALLIKEAYGELGIDVTIQPLLWNQAWAKAKGSTDKRQDLFVWLWWPTYSDGYDNLFGMFHSEEEPAFNLSYWYNKKYDQLIEEAHELSATDVAKAQQLYMEAQRMVIDDAPSVYFFTTMTVSAKRDTIKLDDQAGNPNYPIVIFWNHVTPAGK